MTDPILQNISKAKSNRSILLGVLILVMSLFNINITLANTGVNAQIPYSGTIVGNDGTVLVEGLYKAKFLLYNASSGGTAIYEEIRDGGTSYGGTGVSPALTVSDGRFEILLGSQNTTNFTSILNDDSLWLELQLDMDNNGFYEETFSPRRRLGSALSAINSMRLVANGGTSTNTLSLDSTGNLVFTGDSTTERMRITGGGNVGIGTTTPGSALDIRGTLRLSGSTSGFVGFAPAAAAGGTTYTLPSADGTSNQVLSTNGSGVLSWISASLDWALAGNSTTDSWNGSSGTRLGTTSAQPLVLATTNATAQDIRFFTGAGGANERMRITGGGALIIGNGDTSGTPAAGNLRGTDATGTNISAANFTLTGGRGTGTGVGGDLIFSTAAAGLTGSTLNTANERMRILGNGNIGIGTATPQARLDVNGGIRLGNDTSSCTSSNIGTLRYNNESLQICKNNAWTDSGSGTPTGTPTGTPNYLNVSSNFTQGIDYVITYIDSNNNFVPVPTSNGQTIYRILPTTTKTGTISSSTNLSIQFLIVGGGGGGGGRAEQANSGGGGAGGFRTGTGTILSSVNYALQVGGGGAGGPALSGGGDGGDGTSSYLGMNTSSLTLLSGLITSAGGGGGSTNIGRNGGSGGGSGYGFSPTTQVGLGNTPSTTPSQGNNGYAPGGSGINCAGGGGGAGAPGGTDPGFPTGFASRGGDGLPSNITNIITYYAGGGGGSITSTGKRPAALGGGGVGGANGYGGTGSTPGTDGLGGGGGGNGGGAGQKGGSGIIVIRFPSYN